MNIDRDLLLKKVQKTEDRLLISKILDKLLKVQKCNCTLHTSFMDPHQRNILMKVFEDINDVCISYEGGYEGAERMMAVLRPSFAFYEEEALYNPYLKLLRATVESTTLLTHRDYLGALLGLGLKREKIGDILVKEASCDIIVMQDLAEYIESNLQQVGNARVSIMALEVSALEQPETKVKEVKTTVASTRLDCIAGAGFSMSRSKIAEMIAGEKVSVNWEMIKSPTKEVREGDTISMRGKGRVVVESIGGLTRKGRMGIILKKLV